jgi:hypothetical protein
MVASSPEKSATFFVLEESIMRQCIQANGAAALKPPAFGDLDLLQNWKPSIPFSKNRPQSLNTQRKSGLFFRRMGSGPLCLYSW